MNWKSCSGVSGRREEVDEYNRCVFTSIISFMNLKNMSLYLFGYFGSFYNVLNYSL